MHSRLVVAICIVGLGGAFAGCGSSSKTTSKSTAAAPSTTATASAAVGPEGRYSVTLTPAQLRQLHEIGEQILDRLDPGRSC